MGMTLGEKYVWITLAIASILMICHGVLGLIIVIYLHQVQVRFGFGAEAMLFIGAFGAWTSVGNIFRADRIAR